VVSLQKYARLRCFYMSLKGVRRRGLTGLKPPPRNSPIKIIYSFNFKSGAFYVLQFVQRSQFHNHFITIVAPNRLSAGAPPQTPLGELTVLPRPTSWI